MSRFDAAVVGLGPAGRAAAHRLLEHGQRVLAVDPHPAREWRQTLCGWQSQLPQWLPGDVVAATAAGPLMRTGRDRRIEATYAVLDNDALQRALTLTGATIEEATLDDRQVRALRRRCPVVIDARGARAAGHPAAGPQQTAFGVIVERDQVAALFANSAAVLMDWRPYDGERRWGRQRPTFLYAIPLPGGRALIEETCLAGSPGTSQTELRRRLLLRAERAGVDPAIITAGEVERVVIPLVRQGRSRVRVFRFGAAGAQTNPFSGYSAFASLAAADRLATVVGLGLRRSRLPSDHPGPVRRRALAALLRLSADDTMALFDAFARLPIADQLAILDPTTPPAALAGCLARQWWRLPPLRRIGLVRASFSPGPALPGE